MSLLRHVIIAVFLQFSTAAAFVCGAFASGLAGWIGMHTATRAAVRTTNAARRSLSEALDISFSSGTVMGLSVVGLGLFGVTFFTWIYGDTGLDNALGFSFGASSITMQLVKNVLLYREKTLARKFQELFLTWFVETKFDKDRLFEIYVNVIEYGPGIYGIGPAAWHYFGKHPRDLNPVEAAFFSSILPSPKQRYDQYCKGTLHGWTEGKIERILGLMYKRGRLTETEYQDALATPLIFAKDPDETEAECMARRKKAIKNARPTNPMKK